MVAGSDPIADMSRSNIRDFSTLIGSIGEGSFAQSVLSFAHQLCGASLTSVFHMHCGSTASIASMAPASLDGSNAAHVIARRYVEGKAWLQDPALREARARLDDDHGLLLHTDMSSNWSSQLCENVYGFGLIADRLAIYSKSNDDIIGIGFLRTARSGRFSKGEVERVGVFVEPLLAACRQHLTLTAGRPDVATALTSKDEIVACIADSGVKFPRREAEVCARIIYGNGTAGIAAELLISEETVLTYRKRIYSRLKIATQRELLLWYLRTWSLWGRKSREGHAVH